MHQQDSSKKKYLQVSSKQSTEPSRMLQEYLGGEGVVADRLLKGVNEQKVAARYGKVRDEVNSLVAIISRTAQPSTGQA